MAPSDFPELSRDRFDEDDYEQRRDDLETLEGILADSQLTEDDVEVMDAVVKEGIREHHVELKTGEAKRGMDEI